VKVTDTAKLSTVNAKTSPPVNVTDPSICPPFSRPTSPPQRKVPLPFAWTIKNSVEFRSPIGNGMNADVDCMLTAQSVDCTAEYEAFAQPSSSGCSFWGPLVDAPLHPQPSPPTTICPDITSPQPDISGARQLVSMELLTPDRL
jgi:hypothetical protein